VPESEIRHTTSAQLALKSQASRADERECG
jgi:hypothetical protein